jgi:addiction module HigA family antidote
LNHRIEDVTMNHALSPIPPGEILLEEFLKPMALSQNQLAREIRVPPGRINDIIRNKRGITRDTAARLAIYFGTSVDLWINLQARYDAKIAVREMLPALSRTIRRRVKPAA